MVPILDHTGELHQWSGYWSVAWIDNVTSSRKELLSELMNFQTPWVTSRQCVRQPHCKKNLQVFLPTHSVLCWHNSFHKNNFQLILKYILSLKRKRLTMRNVVGRAYMAQKSKNAAAMGEEERGVHIVLR